MLSRADERLYALEHRITNDHDVAVTSAVGIAGMLLPARKAVAELCP